MKIEGHMVVSAAFGLRAILLQNRPDGAEVNAVLKLGGPEFKGDVLLAKRWGYAAEFCARDFSGSELAMKNKPPELWTMVLEIGSA